MEWSRRRRPSTNTSFRQPSRNRGANKGVDTIQGINRKLVFPISRRLFILFVRISLVFITKIIRIIFLHTLQDNRNTLSSTNTSRTHMNLVIRLLGKLMRQVGRNATAGRA